MQALESCCHGSDGTSGVPSASFDRAEEVPTALLSSHEGAGTARRQATKYRSTNVHPTPQTSGDFAVYDEVQVPRVPRVRCREEVMEGDPHSCRCGHRLSGCVGKKRGVIRFCRCRSDALVFRFDLPCYRRSDLTLLRVTGVAKVTSGRFALRPELFRG